AAGGRVIAVGTTVVRALESTAAEGEAHVGSGWTDLVITSHYEMNVVDGLITGWHQPDSTHLAMLDAIAGHGVVTDSYVAALEAGYLWHEFGDLHLILSRMNT
ncbi:MAG: S-adenosylmethionine:tRNA ribosyltransferase-isomerase, partial [Actinobacteria bacterium]|nr:S-adenosylmethionine:tRNA ribosyltransferase-isomerase [Actinomycetota bacterium]